MVNHLTVAIVQRRLTHYRVPMFHALRESLSVAGVELRVLHGCGTSTEAAKDDRGHLTWAESLPTKYLAGGRLCWLPFERFIKGTSLVILPHENALLANHLRLIRPSAIPFAFWGHGANLRRSRSSLRERYKRWAARRASWYFAYTRFSVELLSQAGFPEARVTQLDNAIDTDSLVCELAKLRDMDRSRARTAFGLRRGPVGLFLGSLYHEKRPEMLVEAAKGIRRKKPGFQLLVVGDGPLRWFVESACSEDPWIRYAGALRGREKAMALSIADINMNPGIVGLSVLDSFAAGVPLVTTTYGLRNPEAAYLSEDNSIITQDNVRSYVSGCLRLLDDRHEHSRLAAGCGVAASRYTLANMVANFHHGVLQALDTL